MQMKADEDRNNNKFKSKERSAREIQAIRCEALSRRGLQVWPRASWWWKKVKRSVIKETVAQRRRAIASTDAWEPFSW